MHCTFVWAPTKSLSEYLEQKLRLRLVFFQKCEEEGFGKG